MDAEPEQFSCLFLGRTRLSGSGPQQTRTERSKGIIEQHLVCPWVQLEELPTGGWP